MADLAIVASQPQQLNDDPEEDRHMVAETAFQLPMEVARRLRSPDGYVLEEVRRYQGLRPEGELQFLDPLLRELEFLRGSFRWSVNALQEMFARQEQLRGMTEQVQARLPAPPTEPEEPAEMQEDEDEEDGEDSETSLREQLFDEAGVLGSIPSLQGQDHGAHREPRSGQGGVQGV